MFSKKLFLSLLLIALIISVGCVNAVDSSNWKTVKVNDVDFKIPPKYQGGEINTARTNYHYNDLNTFGILCVDDYLPSSYGCWYNFKGKNLTIGSHDVAYFHEYNNFAKHNVSHAYFSSGDSIYCISWGSGEMTDEMEEIIINTPDSSYDTATFYGILNENHFKIYRCRTHIARHISLLRPDKDYFRIYCRKRKRQSRCYKANAFKP